MTDAGPPPSGRGRTAGAAARPVSPTGRGGRVQVAVPTVGVGAAVLLGAACLTSLWIAPPPDGDLLLVTWELVTGAGFATAAGVVLGVHRSSWPGRLFLLAAILLLTAPLLRAGGAPMVAAVSTVLAAAVAIPLGLLRVVERVRAQALLRAVDLAVVALGVTSAVATGLGAVPVALVAALGAGVAMFLAGWLQFELTGGDARRQLLWIILGVCSSVSTVLLLMLASEDTPANAPVLAVIVTAPSSVLPLTAAIAIVAPRSWDVRAVISRATVLAVTLTLVVAAYSGVDAGVVLLTGRPLGNTSRLVLVAVIAAAFGPTKVRVRTTMDELLFGGRADPVDTLTRLGGELSAGSAPQEWLEMLRSALAVPSVVLWEGDRIVASCGAASGTATVTTELRAGSEHVGDLVVALPPDHLRVAPATSTVLGLVAAPLAQALHAMRLSERLRASRGRVVGALEEERRRMRRDLHDGLGPTLTGIAYSADAAANLVATDAEHAARLLRELRTDAAEAIAEIRRIVHGLRPSALDELGLVGAVQQRISRLRAADGRPVRVEVSTPEVFPELPAALEVVAYRVAVEAVTNVARHSGVAAAGVAFTVVPGRTLELVVSDLGCSVEPWRPGAGLTSMRERVEQIGGTLAVHAGPDGARIAVSLPLDEDRRENASRCCSINVGAHLVGIIRDSEG